MLPQRSTGNQTLRGPVAKDTVGLHLFPQLSGESVNESCLPPASGKPSARQAVFDLISRNASLEIKCNARGVASIQNLMTVKKRSGLSSEKRVRRMLLWGAVILLRSRL